MKKLFLSFIAISAFTLFSCEKGSSTLECTADAACVQEATVEEVSEEEETAEVDSTSIDTVD
jgi:hypothetical protein